MTTGPGKTEPEQSWATRRDTTSKAKPRIRIRTLKIERCAAHPQHLVSIYTKGRNFLGLAMIEGGRVAGS
jgi:hypothetical protein